VKVIVAENLSASLAHTASADVKSGVAAITLGEENRFLEEGHAAKTIARSRGVYTAKR